MSTINVSFDTKSKKLSVMVDGQPLKNVSRLSVYRGHDEEDKQNYVEVAIETDEYNNDTELAKNVIFMSRGCLVAQAALKQMKDVSHPQLPDLVGVIEPEPVVQDIHNFFSRN